MSAIPPRPTDFEFEILQELWSAGPLTVRQVHDKLNSRRPLVYTTVLKAMQIMNEKGLVTRDDSERAHLYRAAAEEGAVKNRMLERMIDTAFAGSAVELAMRALSVRRASDDEIRRIKELLGQMDDTEDGPRGG